MITVSAPFQRYRYSNILVKEKGEICYATCISGHHQIVDYVQVRIVEI